MWDDWDDDRDDENHPCETCPTRDTCDGWEAQFCCTLCMYIGAAHCEDCDPFDI